MKKGNTNFIPAALLVSNILLGIICLVHLFAFITYLFNAEISPYLFPASVIVAIGLSFLLAGKFNSDKKQVSIAAAISILLLIISIAVACFYFDLSWDGQAYHQTAVYDLAGKWNPLYHSLETPDHTNDRSVLFFPKNSWIVGAALLRLFGTVEAGKAYNFIMLFVAAGVVYPLCRSFKMKIWQAISLSILVLLNPVVWSELPGYLNDGDIYLLLVTYLAAFILWLREPKPLLIAIGTMAVICLVNVKFTGLVFFLVSSLFIFIYVIFKERKMVKPFLISHLLAGVLAVGVFGFNPYLTNIINRGNPFYPVLGSAKFPKGSDTNEKFETPKNMKGKSLPVRLFYANFGQPGNAPYNKEKNATLVWPFSTGPGLWKAYYFQETRVSGFGPYFGVLLLITIILLPILLARFKTYCFPVLMFLSCLICSLALSKHFWWPRFFPLLWLLPILPLFLLWINGANSGKGFLKAPGIYSLLLAILISANGLIVACVHMQWETTSSNILRAQLKTLSRQQKPIEVDYGKFKRSVEEKLNYWNITYTPASLKHSTEKPHKLMSVVKGYPNQVLYLQR